MWFIKAKANLHQAYVTLTELGYEVLIYLVQWLQTDVFHCFVLDKIMIDNFLQPSVVIHVKLEGKVYTYTNTSSLSHLL